MTAAVTARLLAALRFAAERHRAQRRKDAERSPYINHVIDVTELLARAGVVDEDVLIAAALHDTVEDTGLSLEELERLFGARVRALVAEVTDDKRLPAAERKRLQIERAPRASADAKLIKLADKACNVRDLVQAPPADWPPERRMDYLAWSAAVVAGCRGTNATLEAEFDRMFSVGLVALLPGAGGSTSAPAPAPSAPAPAAASTPPVAPTAAQASPAAPPAAPTTPEPPRRRMGPTPRTTTAVSPPRSAPAPAPRPAVPTLKVPERVVATPAPAPAPATAAPAPAPPAAPAAPAPVAPAAAATPVAPPVATPPVTPSSAATPPRAVAAVRSCAGVDACQGGWAVATIDDQGGLDVSIVPEFARLVRQARAGQFDYVVVDVPIGLPDTESRRADVEARRLLRSRGSVIIPAPRRPMLAARTYEEASDIRERLDGRRINKQAFALQAKIREIDDIVDAPLQRTIREGNPEVTFCILNGGEPVTAPPETPEGRAVRTQLLRVGFAQLGVAFDGLPEKPRGASTDDVIDALAMLVSALRASRGEARSYPNRPEYDERGLRAEMVA